MLTSAQALLGSLLVCFAGALITLLTARNRTLCGWLAFLATLISSSLALYAAGRTLVHGPEAAETFLSIPAWGFALRLYVDGLTAFFIGLIASIALPATFYSIHYMKHYAEYSVGRYYPYLMLFLAAMYGLVSTTDMMWFFFIFWQMMTLPGYALIRFESKNRANLRAANRFLVMMQIACFVTMIGAEILAVETAAASGTSVLKYDFDTVSEHLPTLLREQGGWTALAFVLFLVGFGIKLGMWPFGQFWLPNAHPAAPSPVSALLSGVMIKTGIYGIMRYFLWLVPTEAQADYPAARWGAVIAVLGTVTLFTGTMQALRQGRTKRLLAFHSIGQVGYILLGIGACLALLNAADGGALATLAFIGALFHTLNHATFKSLLFLNSGSILHATGTQELNRLGGLMRYMPLTAVTALIASFSISGVPLFNGFVSKWCIYGAAIRGTPWAGYLAICAVVAIITSALTLASFIKFFGASFLTRTSSLVREQAARGPLEVRSSMQAPQWFLAAFCVLFGLLPGLAFGLAAKVLTASQQGLGAILARAHPVETGLAGGTLALDAGAVYTPLILLVLMGLLMLMAASLVRMAGSQRRQAEPWLCGYARETESVRYSAHNFYIEIKRWFGWLGGADPVLPLPVRKEAATVKPTREATKP